MTRTQSPYGELCNLAWIATQVWPQHPSKLKGTTTLVDLFCGCGGLTLGAWEASRTQGFGMDIRLAADLSPHALKVYRSNFDVGTGVGMETDINELFPGDMGSPFTSMEQELRQRVGMLDMLVAGPPCQGHSDLNNHTRRDDPRNKLYLKVLRATELLRPEFLLVENVPTVVHDASNVVAQGLHRLRELKYDVRELTINAEDFGLPQRRRRHILIASRTLGLDALEAVPSPPCARSPLSEYLAHLEDEHNTKKGIFYSPSRMSRTNNQRTNYLFEHDVFDLPDELRPPCHRDKKHSYVSMYGRLRWDQPAQTITTGFGSMGQGRFVHPTRKRTLTPHEAARIQGFLDFFDFTSVTQRGALQNMIGNAVPPRIAAHILSVLLAQRKREQEEIHDTAA